MSMTTPPRSRNPLRRFVRIMRTRPRLIIAIAVGLVAGAVVPWDWRGATRALVSWDIAVAFYLIAVTRLMMNCSIAQIRHRAATQDEGRFAIPAIIVAAALASLAAIGVVLGASHGSDRRSWSLALAAVTILLSWTLTHMIFALHYAHEYYDENAHQGGGLNFPGESAPGYWDFVYFSFVIGMTSQVSDVAVTSHMIRRMVTAHGVLSFIFNVTLIALTVNIAAGAIL
jgi:uncharacterized membrane protein